MRVRCAHPWSVAFNSADRDTAWGAPALTAGPFSPRALLFHRRLGRPNPRALEKAGLCVRCAPGARGPPGGAWPV